MTVVGLGPGDASLLAPAARMALERADAVVGYKGYMKFVAPELLEGREVFSTGMTGEVERGNKALEYALQGLNTVVVSSGDAGIYAMSGLVLELLESRKLAHDLEFEVVPGIPALAAAAALLGAPLMHDFACISLSDLLTPWEVIEKRLEYAARGDFVIILYNPKSRKRAGHLQKALDIVGSHRSVETPAGIVSRAFRPGQRVTVTTLAGLDPEEADMQSIVVLGNSSTRASGGRMLTPRGYSGKYVL